MDVNLHKAKSNQTTSYPLPWWTWLAPLLVANIGTWLSIWFKTDPGTSLWYLPTALGIVMVYWWGPRALLGIYINAVVCAPLWGLPWKYAPLYALPETIEVGLSWFFFIKLGRGKSWLPDLGNVGKFLFLGSVTPTFLANLYLVWQLYLLKNITSDSIWSNWQVLFSADLATHFVLAVPVLILFTRNATKKGWTLITEKIQTQPFLPEERNSPFDIAAILIVFITAPLFIFLFHLQDLRIGYGFMMILLAIRYGIYIAVVGISWIGLISMLLPVILLGKLGLPTSGYIDFLTNNLNILFLCGVTLVTGRAISDLFAEIVDHKQSETGLREAETKYRTLVEQIPPIIYISEPNQHVGVTYISPQIEKLGFKQKEWLNDPQLWFRQIHPEDQPKVMKYIEISATNNKPSKLEYRFLTHSGNVIWLLDEVVNVLDKDGKTVFRQGYMLDITARKLAEEALSTREQYLALINDMTHAILLSNDIDLTMNMLAMNMTKLIHADDCYITRWDTSNQQIIPVTSTAKLKTPYKEDLFPPNEQSMTQSVIEAGYPLVANDVFNSPYISLNIARRYPARSVLGIPLLVGSTQLGAVLLAFNTPHEFSKEEIESAEHAGNQVSLALWNFQQGLEIQHRLKESNTLAEISRALSETERIGLSKVLNLIVNSAMELIPAAEHAVIHLLDHTDDTLFPAAVSSLQEPVETKNKMRLGKGVAGEVLTKGETINIADINSDSRFVQLDFPVNFNSLMVAPVISGEKKLGTISIQSSSSNAFNDEENRLLSALGIQAAIAIENANLLESTQQALKEANALYHVNQRLAASLDPQELLEDVVELLQVSFDYYHVQIYITDLESGDLVMTAGSGEIGKKLKERGYRLRRGEGLVGYAAETGESFFTNDVDEFVFFVRNPLLSNTKSELAVPVKDKDEILGMLDIQQIPPKLLTQQDIHLVSAVADQLAVALQKAKLHENLQNSLEQEKAIRDQLLQNERLTVMGRLLATVSHELNNPLQAIQNALFLLKEEKGISEQGRQDLNIVLAESEHMANMIERLRDTYRPTRIQDFQLTQINNTIEDVHALISTHLRHNNIALEFHPDPDLPQIPALADQLRQVVLNLLMNAVEAMSNGGRLVVSTKLLNDINEILITVTDSGKGIDPSILPNIFEAFVTNKKTGTGLGLTITYDIIMRHQGRIKAENNEEHGTTFSIWLPANNKEIE